VAFHYARNCKKYEMTQLMRDPIAVGNFLTNLIYEEEPWLMAEYDSLGPEESPGPEGIRMLQIYLLQDFLIFWDCDPEFMDPDDNYNIPYRTEVVGRDIKEKGDMVSRLIKEILCAYVKRDLKIFGNKPMFQLTVRQMRIIQNLLFLRYDSPEIQWTKLDLIVRTLEYALPMNQYYGFEVLSAPVEEYDELDDPYEIPEIYDLGGEPLREVRALEHSIISPWRRCFVPRYNFCTMYQQCDVKEEKKQYKIEYHVLTPMLLQCKSSVKPHTLFTPMEWEEIKHFEMPMELPEAIPIIPIVPVKIKGKNYKKAWGDVLSLSHARSILRRRVQPSLDKYKNMEHQFKLNLNPGGTDREWDSFAKVVEDTAWFMATCMASTNKKQVMLAAIGYIKLMLGETPIFSVEHIETVTLLAQTMFENDDEEEPIQFNEYQSLEFATSFTDTLRAMFDNFMSLKDRPLFKKLYKLIGYIVSMKVFGLCKLPWLAEYFGVIEGQWKTGTWGTDFIKTLCDFVIFAMEKLVQCFKLGSAEPLFHSSTSYTKWFDESNEMLIYAKHLNGVGVMKITRPEYIFKLSTLITQGHAMKRVCDGTFHKQLIQSMLMKLIDAENEIIAFDVALKSRKMPLGVLVIGTSSVGKTSFIECLWQHFAKVRGFPADEQYKYVRNCVEEWWNNFRSHHICLVLDDLGYRDPKISPNGDPSCMEILIALNNVAFCPPQASLDHKGKTPMRVELCIATSNFKTGNVEFYFPCWLAALRRFKLVIWLTVKQEFLKDGQFFDSTKAPEATVYEYPNWWDIAVYRVVPQSVCKDISKLAQKGDYKHVHTFTDINEFMAFYAQIILKHDIEQEKFMKFTTSTLKIELCERCYAPRSGCVCALLCEGCDKLRYVCECQVTQADNEEEDHDDSASVTQFIAETYDRYTHSLRREFNQCVGNGNKLLQNTLLFAAAAHMPEQSILARAFKRGVMFFLATEIGSSVLIMVTRDKKILGMIMAAIGRRVQRKLGISDTMLKYAKYAGGVVSLTIAGGMLYRYMRPKKNEMVNQALRPAIAIRPSIVTEWTRNTFLLTPHDLQPLSTSWATMGIEEFEARIARNMISVDILRDGNTTIKVSHTHMFAVHDCLYACNTHAIPDGLFVLKANSQSAFKVNQCVEVQLSPSEVYRCDGDLTFLYIRKLPSCPKLTGLFAKKPLPGVMNATLLTVPPSSLEQVPFPKVSRDVQQVKFETIGTVHKQHPGYGAWCLVPTVSGDCGGIYYMHCSMGYVLLGMHSTGAIRAVNGLWQVGIQHILQEDIEKATAYFGKPVAEPTNIMVNQSGKYLQTNVHSKATVNYIEEGRGFVVTGVKGFRSKGKSRVTCSVLTTTLHKAGYKSNFVIPSDLNSADTDMIALTTRLGDRKGFPPCVIDRAVKCFLEDIRRGLPADWKDVVHEVDVFTAINGKAGVNGLQPLDFNTSMGYPWKTPKKKFTRPARNNPNPIEMPDAVEFLEEFEALIREKYECYRNAQLCHPIYSASKKDEAVSREKDLLRKYRVFTGAPFWSTVCMRMALAWIPRLIGLDPFLFETAAGMNLLSCTWALLHDYLCALPYYLAGDYKNFDTLAVDPVLLIAVFNMFIELAKEAGAEKEWVDAMYCMGVDTAFNVVDWFGTILMFFGGTPSGVFVTLFFNSMCNSLLMRCVYMVLNPEGECASFKKNVHLITLGDDLLLSVSDQASCFFNFNAIKDVFAEVKIVFTPADKSESSPNFIPLNQADFAKRSFMKDNELNMVLGPLRLESIMKMMLYNRASAHLSPQQCAVDALVGASREFFFYGRKNFNAQREKLMKVVVDGGLGAYIKLDTFPSYDKILDKFKRNCAQADLHYPWIREETKKIICGLGQGVASMEETKTVPDILVTDYALLLEEDNRVENTDASPGRSPKHHQCEVGSALKTEYQSRIAFVGSGRIKSRDKHFITFNTEVLGEVDSHYFFGRNIDYMITQSLETTNIEMMSAPLVEFVDTEVSETYKVYGTTVANPDGEEKEATLDKFLSRPILVNTFIWLTSTPVNTEVRVLPWTQILNNPAVLKKITNYAYIRATLKMKLTVNATPFVYGAILAVFRPMSNSTLFTNGYGGYPALFPTNYNGALVQLTQLPHVWLYPGKSKGAEMTIPFLFNQNALQLVTNSTAITDNFGVLEFWNVVALESANGGAVDGVTINTFAWLEDVELTGPTVGVAYQSKEDEYGKGPVSSVATAIGSLASKFTQVPIIGKYATATQMGAKFAAMGLSALGFTNVPVIDSVHAFKPTVSSGFANSEVPFQNEKLALDPKNELSLDNSIFGFSNQDELSLSYLLTKEALLGQFNWNQAQGTHVRLFSWAPSPPGAALIDTTTIGGSYSIVNATPMSYFSNMFQYWRGDIVLRFNVVCSTFHRGRLRIVYDPSGDSANNIMSVTDSGTTMNMIYSETVDISESTNFEITIPYMQPALWSKIGFVSSSYAPTPVFGSGGFFQHAANVTNGTIAIYVLNELSGPVATADLNVLVFARAGSNMEYAGYSPHWGQNNTQGQLNLSLMRPQSASSEIQKYSLGGNTKDVPTKYLTNFGEAYVSLRSLLHRTNYIGRYAWLPTSSSVSASYMQFFRKRFPVPYGWYPNMPTLATQTVTTGTNPFSFENMHPLSFIAICFLGQRGSGNWNFAASTTLAQQIYVNVARAPWFGISYNSVAVVGSSIPYSATIGTQAYAALIYSDSLNAGGAMEPSSIQPVVSVSVPNFSPYYFNGTFPAWQAGPFTTPYPDGSDQEFIVVDVRTETNSNPVFLDMWFGGGADYNVVGFLFCPPLYLYASTPLAI
jgi:hypothetical protein